MNSSKRSKFLNDTPRCFQLKKIKKNLKKAKKTGTKSAKALEAKVDGEVAKAQKAILKAAKKAPTKAEKKKILKLAKKVDKDQLKAKKAFKKANKKAPRKAASSVEAAKKKLLVPINAFLVADDMRRMLISFLFLSPSRNWLLRQSRSRTARSS